MHQKTKKFNRQQAILSLFLSILLIFWLLPSFALADDENTDEVTNIDSTIIADDNTNCNNESNNQTLFISAETNANANSDVATSSDTNATTSISSESSTETTSENQGAGSGEEGDNAISPDSGTVSDDNQSKSEESSDPVTVESGIAAIQKNDGLSTFDSLQAAIDAAADDDTIFLCAETTEDLAMSSKSLTIDLQGNTIHASSDAVLTVNGGTVSIKNGTLTDGRDGGLVVNNATLTASNITLSNCSSPNGWGNVFVYCSTVNFNNSTIKNNTSSYYGAGVCLYKDAILNGSALTIQNNSFNTTYGDAYRLGGGIYSDSTSKIALTNGSLVTGNSAYQGGGIFSYGEVLIEGSTISNNTATGKYSGAGIYTCGGGITIKDSAILNNSGYNYGGGITVYSNFSADSYGTLKYIDIENSSITGNSVKNGIAGGAYLYGNTTATIKESTFQDNSAKGAGGGLYASCPTTISDSVFKANKGANGAAVYLDGPGGGTPVHFRLTNVEFTGQASDSAASVLYALTSNDADATEWATELNNCRFYGNSASKYILDIGGYGSNKNVRLVNCSLTNNTSGTATIDTGIASTNISFEGSEVSNNQAGCVGAMLIKSDSTSLVEFSQTVIKNNSATQSGDFNASNSISAPTTGGICLISGQIDFKSGALYNNTSTSSQKTNDLYVAGYNSISNNAKASLLAASAMQDGDTSFANYVWQDAQTASNIADAVTVDNSAAGSTTPACITAKVTPETPRYVAHNSTSAFATLEEAIDATDSTDTIVLGSGTGEDEFSALTTEPITIDKPVTIDLNGWALYHAGATSVPFFNIEDGGSLTLAGSGAVNGFIQAKGNVSLSGSVTVEKVVQESGTLNLAGYTADSLSVELGETAVIDAGGSLDCASLVITLPPSVANAFNDANQTPSDVVIVKGVTEADKDNITLANISDSLVSLVWTSDEAAAQDPTSLAASVEGAAQVGSVALHRASISGVFLDGVNGNDANDGLTYSTPVKTFEHAKEVLAANSSLDAIYIINEVTVKDGAAATWSLPEGKSLCRYPSYLGRMVVVNGASLTLENITIDGMCAEYGINSADSMIAVIGDSVASSLVINDGAVLQNNNVNHHSASIDDNQGGAVYAHGTVMAPVTVAMNGGTIKDCVAWKGGGIYLLGNTSFAMNGGTITGNSAAESVKSNLASGGGVCVDANAYMEFNDGTIQNNSASYGGGVALGGYYVLYNMAGTQNFVMNGGTLDSNRASSAGGGLFVQCTMLSTINAGKITNNYGGSGNFGGGGIYVNGGRSTTLTTVNDGVCQLYNVAITDNTAGIEGGGIAGCSTSTIDIYQHNGSVIYDNTANSQPSDVLSSNSDGNGSSKGIPSKWISPEMLNNSAYLWQYIGDGVYVSGNALQEKGAISIYTTQTEAAAQAAQDAKVIISGNSAQLRGGGIGTNGVVKIGDEPSSSDSSVTVSVTKVWNDEGSENVRPNSIRVFLLRDGQKYSCLEFEGENLAGTLTFKDLPTKAADGHEYVYTVEEEPISVEGGTYESKVSDPVETEGNIAYTITNTFVPTEPGGEPTPTSEPEPEPINEPEPETTPDETTSAAHEESSADAEAEAAEASGNLAPTSDYAGFVLSCGTALLTIAAIGIFVVTSGRRKNQ